MSVFPIRNVRIIAQWYAIYFWMYLLLSLGIFFLILITNNKYTQSDGNMNIINIILYKYIQAIR